MELFGCTVAQWFVLVQHELLLFAAFFYLLGAIDEFAVDIVWLRLRLTGRGDERQFDTAFLDETRLSGDRAVFIPPWQESKVLGQTIRHMLTVWPHREFRLYVGCYPNGPETIKAAMSAAAGDASPNSGVAVTLSTGF